MKKTEKKRKKKNKNTTWNTIEKIWDIAKKILGISFIIIGIISLFLPFLQGIVLILIGYALLKNKKIEGCIEYLVSIIKKLKRGEKVSLTKPSQS